MGLIYIDQKLDKAACVHHLKCLQIAIRGRDLLDKGVADECFAHIKRVTADWQVDQGKLFALLGSQVYSGNIPGAIKVIEGAIPDRRMRLLPLIVFSLVLWPFRLVGRILGLGFKRG
jgi:hypothetical protein